MEEQKEQEGEKRGIALERMVKLELLSLLWGALQRDLELSPFVGLLLPCLGVLCIQGEPGAQMHLPHPLASPWRLRRKGVRKRRRALLGCVCVCGWRRRRRSPPGILQHSQPFPELGVHSLIWGPASSSVRSLWFP